MKKSIREKIRPSLVKHNTLYSSLRFTHSIFSELTSSLHTLPNFLIIGTAKSGTTSLFEHLIKHPSIFPPLAQQPNYFTSHYQKSESWYRSFFPSIIRKNIIQNVKKQKFLTGEASTQYYWYPHAAKRVKSLLPNAKIILLLRNPIDRSYSQYQMEFTKGNEELTSFEDAIELENERIQDEYKKMLQDKNYYSKKYTIQSYITKSIYVNYIEEWLKYFPKEQFLFLNSEEFNSDTSKVYKKTLNFLGVSEIDFKKYDVFRAAKYSEMNSNTRKKLSEFFKPHNERLYKLIDQNFDWD
jgi:hypothetical protein